MGVKKQPIDDIPVQLVYQPTKNQGTGLAWDLSIHQLDQKHWWNVRVNATTNEIMARADWVVNEDFEAQRRQAAGGAAGSFELAPGTGQSKAVGGAGNNDCMVYEWPRESPLHNPQGVPGPPDEGRTLQIAPWTAASPFGWHDDDGVAGAEYTITRGNNAWASEDVSASGSGSSPDCGPFLDCNFALGLSTRVGHRRRGFFGAKETVSQALWCSKHQQRSESGVGTAATTGIGATDAAVATATGTVTATATDGGGIPRLQFRVGRYRGRPAYPATTVRFRPWSLAR